MWQTGNNVIAQVDLLLDNYTYEQIASLLNEQGLRSGKGNEFSGILVGNISREYGLKSRWHRLRDKGLLTVEEMADRLEVSTSTVEAWHKHGLLKAYVYNDKQQHLYESPGVNRPFKCQGRKLSKRFPLVEFVSDHAKEVQYEA
jgi:hypothetical protein